MDAPTSQETGGSQILASPASTDLIWLLVDSTSLSIMLYALFAEMIRSACVNQACLEDRCPLPHPPRPLIRSAVLESVHLQGSRLKCEGVSCPPFCIPTRQNPRRVQPEGLVYRDSPPQYEGLQAVI